MNKTVQAVPEPPGKIRLSHSGGGKCTPEGKKKKKKSCGCPLILFVWMCVSILQVNGVQLCGKSRREAVTFLKEVPPPFTLVCCRRLFGDGTESLVDEPPVALYPPEQKVTLLLLSPPCAKRLGLFRNIHGFAWVGLEELGCPGKTR